MLDKEIIKKLYMIAKNQQKTIKKIAGAQPRFLTKKSKDAEAPEDADTSHSFLQKDFDRCPSTFEDKRCVLEHGHSGNHYVPHFASWIKEEDKKWDGFDRIDYMMGKRFPTEE